MKTFPSKPNQTLSAVLWLAGGTFFLSLVVLAAALQSTAAGGFAAPLRQLLAANSVQLMWYVTRASGMTAYLLMWLSTAWGLAVSNKILDHLLHRSFTYDFHEFLSLAAIAFTIIHVGVLMFDRYLPYNLAQILVPFLSPYRPVWVGIGVIGFYLILLVSITFYMRDRIGIKAFRWIHGLSLVSYLAVTAHSFFAGTDTPLVSVIGLYGLTFIVVVFLLAYWPVSILVKKISSKDFRYIS
jgi:sulfoxide reductase heme-binding subunit YedZ